MKFPSLIAALAAACCLPSAVLVAQPRPAPAQTSAESVAQRDAADLASFDREAAAAAARGATSVAITPGLPPALWEFDSPGDPYPAWYVAQQGIMKIFTPDALKPYIDQAWAQRTAHLVEERCKILRKYNLKGLWTSDEPQQLPEAFFRAHPELRGPRVDQPNRSRVPRFSPSVDEPETLRLYREALKKMWATCPEIQSFAFLTSDSGSGFDWVPALYAGLNGNTKWKDRPMADRVAGFMKNFQTAADEAGQKFKVTVALNPIQPRQWMTQSFSPDVLISIVKQLPAGMSVSGREGPDGHPATGAGRGGSGERNGPFSPVVGLALPAGVGGGRGGRGRDASAPNPVERATALRQAAVELVGEESANDCAAMWEAETTAQTRLSALDFGAMLRFGTVLTRWINRPMVCLPEQLTDQEKSYYRPFLLQARTEAQANDLADVQGMLMYKGWGAHLLFQHIIETTIPDIKSAQAAARRIAERQTDAAKRHEWELNAKRFEAVVCLLICSDDMVAFQAHLDRIKDRKLQAEYSPELSAGSDWARTDMMEIARREIDNTVHLMQLLRENGRDLIDMAPTPQEEYVMHLGPDLPNQLQRKIDIMNAHWLDFDRFFTIPNL